jgi:hypothetical protein
MFGILSQCALNACGPDMITPGRLLELAERPQPGRTLQLASVRVGHDPDVAVSFSRFISVSGFIWTV